jgi:IS30 family transposase
LVAHKKIIETERRLLAQWKKEGISNIECAKRLGRHESTIGTDFSKVTDEDLEDVI